MDYLKITVWADVESVRQVLEEGIIERDLLDLFDDWEDRGRMSRVSHSWEACGLIRVLEYRSADGLPGQFVSVELRGQAIGLVGEVAVWDMVSDLRAFGWRCRVSRLDYKWDHVPFDCAWFVAAVDRGSLLSRSVTRDDLSVWDSSRKVGEGTTVYLGASREADRLVRLYDKRGYPRLELELKGDVAAEVGSRLFAMDPKEWPLFMVSVLRGYFDLIEPCESVKNRNRSPLLPEWKRFAELFGESERLRVRPQKHEREQSLSDKLESHLSRVSPMIADLLEAYGWEWFVQFVEQESRNRRDPATVAVLKKVFEWKRTNRDADILPF